MCLTARESEKGMQAHVLRTKREGEGEREREREKRVKSRFETQLAPLQKPGRTRVVQKLTPYPLFFF